MTEAGADHSKTLKRAYVASTFRLADRIPHVEKILNDADWEIIDRWWLDDAKVRLPKTSKGFYAIPEVQAIAERHWSAIRDCDALVLVAGKEPLRFTGAAIEFGYAHALGKPLVVYGFAKLSAMWAPAIHCTTTQQFAQTMRALNYSIPRSARDD